MAILGIDWGERRIGLAVSWSGELATPLAIVANDGDLEQTLERISEHAREVEPESIVLGVPAAGRHDSAAIRDRFEAIAGALRQRICKTVVLWDEGYSTTEALSRRRESGRSRRRSREPIDSLAAAVILQSYIDEALRKDKNPQ